MKEEIIQAVAQIIPKIPHQFCKTHILRGIDRVLKIQPIHSQLSKLLKRLRGLKSLFIYPYSPKKESLLKELKTTHDKITHLKRKHQIPNITQILKNLCFKQYSPKSRDSPQKDKKIKNKFNSKKKIYNLINNLIKYKNNIFAHLKTPFLPYTNNQLENLIKQYERRLKTIEGFGKNKKAIEGYLNLMAIC